MGSEIRREDEKQGERNGKGRKGCKVKEAILILKSKNLRRKLVNPPMKLSRGAAPQGS